MTNMFDYLKWRGDFTFSQSPLNEIDALIFSEMLYAPFDDFVSSSLNVKGIPLSILAEKFFTLNYDRNKIGAIIPTDDILKLFKLASKTERFANVTVKGFINEVDVNAQKQFCATCYDIGNNTIVVAYRGTDDTIIGWKEDLNMAFFTPIPSQKRGNEYLINVIEKSGKEKFYVCGHSKGGNLAAYSVLELSEEYKTKIVSVYNFDGPGFIKEYVEKHNENSIISKMKKFMPQSSFIGAIFNSCENCTYIKSTAKGLYQHDAFSWQLMGKELERVQSPSKASVNFHDTLDKWVENMTDREKRDFVDALYKFLTVNDATTLTDIVSDKTRFVLGILKTDEKTKKTVISSLNRLIKEKYFKRK